MVKKLAWVGEKSTSFLSVFACSQNYAGRGIKVIKMLRRSLLKPPKCMECDDDDDDVGTLTIAGRFQQKYPAFTARVTSATVPGTLTGANQAIPFSFHSS